MHRRTLNSCIKLSALMFSCIVLAAFSAANSQDDRVLVALTQEGLPEGTSALLVRTAGATQPDLIVIPDDANAAASLGGALALLQQQRQREKIATHSTRMSIRGAVAPRRGRSELLQRLGARIRAARQKSVRRSIAGIGQVEVFSLPSARLRGDD